MPFRKKRQVRAIMGRDNLSFIKQKMRWAKSWQRYPTWGIQLQNG